MKIRVEEATTSLQEAIAAEDDYLAEVRLAELQELQRLAADHDLVIDGVAETIATHTGPIQIVDVSDERADSAARQ